MAELVRELRESCGHCIEDVVVGRTLLRDQLVRSLNCSMLEAEQLVDTMIARGFIRQGELSDGREGLLIDGG
ncbi:MAG TPA: hypothetical protein VFN67_16695 [Polyangiales bacterium]|nr:hypothetical protein [Polyangiales bacterium]